MLTKRKPLSMLFIARWLKERVDKKQKVLKIRHEERRKHQKSDIKKENKPVARRISLCILGFNKKMKKIIAICLILTLFICACTNTAKTEENKTSVTTGQDEKNKEVAENGKTEETKAPQSEAIESRLVVDAAGREVIIPQKVTSIVCVGVGSLRFTCYMQATDLVVGVEENERNPKVTKPFSYINREAFANLPLTGDNGKTYDEEIIKVAPQVIMATADKETAELLQQKTGIPVVAVPLIDSMFGEKSDQMIELMGQVYGKEERAKELMTYIHGLQADLEKRTAGIKEEDKPGVYVGGVSFKGHHGFEGTEAGYAPFAAVGAKNLADQTGQKGAFNVDLEQVLQWNPDVVFLDFNGMSLIKEDYAKNPDYYNSLAAVKNGKLYSQISFRYNAVNAELSLADAYYVGKVLYPEEFSDVDIAQKTDEIFEMMLGVKFYDTLKANGYEFKEMKIGE